MTEYKGNSHRSREAQERELKKVEDKKIEKVTSGSVRTKKKSGASKFAEVFIAEDVTSVKDYILMDVLLPAAKKAISDIVVNGIDMILYGESRNRKKSSGGSGRVSYSSYYDRDRDRGYERERRVSRVRTGYEYDEIILETRGEAEDVLGRMDDLIDAYGIVSVADLYDLVGMTGNYTDNKYGWTNLRNASIQRLRDGYLLKLPKALPID